MMQEAKELCIGAPQHYLHAGPTSRVVLRPNKPLVHAAFSLLALKLLPCQTKTVLSSCTSAYGPTSLLTFAVNIVQRRVYGCHGSTLTLGYGAFHHTQKQHNHRISCGHVRCERWRAIASYATPHHRCMVAFIVCLISMTQPCSAVSYRA